MNIPDEVGEQAMKADDTWEFIAEWARKEALREAADCIDPNIPLRSGFHDALTDAADRIRALAEGDN